VRVGALHALAWLAESSPRYKQTVLDVLGAYLRRQFTHPSYTRRADDPDQLPSDDFPDPLEDDRERQVRLTAQRLITDLLPWSQNPDSRAYHLDLTGGELGALPARGQADRPPDGAPNAVLRHRPPERAAREQAGPVHQCDVPGARGSGRGPVPGRHLLPGDDLQLRGRLPGRVSQHLHRPEHHRTTTADRHSRDHRRDHGQRRCQSLGTQQPSRKINRVR
jgi:hypothetical protein